MRIRGSTRYIFTTRGPTDVSCSEIAKDCEVIKLPNVGMCDHTYLYDIVENSMTNFLQRV